MSDSPYATRRAGILLHITSLPGAGECGTLGPDAYRFVDFLVASGHSVWQMLPIGPTHDDGSPYQCLSLHAGNPLFISAELLRRDGWLKGGAETSAGESPVAQMHRLLERAWSHFQQHANEGERRALHDFIARRRAWLDDYALYMAVREEQSHRGWLDWPAPLRDRDTAALGEARRRLESRIELFEFAQFVFFRQWNALKEYANHHGVLLFGDMPIFVAHDSADVWAQRDYFQLDAGGRPSVVAGVPPDYFSATGQRWGNPHYRWDRMQADGFKWWISRLDSQLHLFDLMRVDHFRGFEAYWEIPADHDTAMHGHWVQAPGDPLFAALKQRFDPLPLVAEDLGIITPEVDALRERYGFPGMKILQFAFDGGPHNPYLPHMHQPLSVVYTGTHDNDTTLGWYNSLTDEARNYMHEYLGDTSEPMPWLLMRTALASVAVLSIVPMQDVLGLDGAHRMNTPGTTQGNWRWRFQWQQLNHEAAPRMRRLVQLYGRLRAN